MSMRIAVGLTALACCLAVSMSATRAQTYPGTGYPGAAQQGTYPPGTYQSAPPPGYRSLPPVDPDDEPDDLPPPGGGVEQQALPPPGNYPPRSYSGQPYPGQVNQGYPNQGYPNQAYPNQAVPAQPPSGAPGGYPPQPAGRATVDDASYGMAPVRPPADIRGGDGGSIIDINRPAASVPGPPIDINRPAAAAVPGQGTNAPPPGFPAPFGFTPPPAAVPNGGAAVASLPPEDQPEVGTPKELPPNLRRQLVDYVTREPAGTIVIDTPNTYLYLVLGNGKAMRYGVGVGREGFTWAGAERITRMKEWPDWFPPSEMIERQPYLPRFMAGGETNPLGARALYLGKTVYRIHGTNQPSTIGTFVSSGCIRLVNDDIIDLFGRVQVGTRVVVLPGRPAAEASAASAPPAR